MIQPSGIKLDIPTADFWCVRDGKIQEFNCRIGMATMHAQTGVLPDVPSAVAVSAPGTIRPIDKDARLRNGS